MAPDSNLTHCVSGDNNPPLCRKYSYPDPSQVASVSMVPTEPSSPYTWEDLPEVKRQLGSRQLTTLAR